MTDVADWSLAVDPNRGIGRAVEFHAQIGSTSDRARAALREPGGEGLAVVADLQTAGRGRRGRSWVSPSGVNLLVSVALRPALPAGVAGLLGVATALAVRDACAGFAPGAGLAIRWPNDVVDRDGRKVAGLLLETAIEGGRLAEAVIGMGVNANWLPSDMPLDIATRATSLLALSGEAVDRVALLRAVLDALDLELRALSRGESPVPRARGGSWLDGRRVEIDTGTGIVTGLVAGIADDGSLLLDAEAGRLALTVGEVARVHESVAAVRA
jgi:BirA family biotin operon repressor/biotin-[acetyl-CoA-carboxylase] ligase